MLGVARRMDVNCDIGETAGSWHASHEPELLEIITSANVACGGHAGSDESMHAICERAARIGVTIGAQVSYPDRPNFGRIPMNISLTELFASLCEQYDALDAIARLQGTRVSYVKPHGALYNTAARDADHAEVVVRLAEHHQVALFGLPASQTEVLATMRGVRFLREWFADRGYLSSGELAPRSRPDALITDPTTIASRVTQVVRDGTVTCIDGSVIHVDCDTMCVHSDTPGAARLLWAVRDALTTEQVVIRAH